MRLSVVVPTFNEALHIEDAAFEGPSAAGFGFWFRHGGVVGRRQEELQVVLPVVFFAYRGAAVWRPRWLIRTAV